MEPIERKKCYCPKHGSRYICRTGGPHGNWINICTVHECTYETPSRREEDKTLPTIKEKQEQERFKKLATEFNG